MKRFTKTRRLLNKSEFNYVFTQKHKITTREFIVLYSFNQIGCSRLGLALSKKMIAKAHDRNRIKRLIRETFRNKELPAIDIVVLARRKDVAQTALVSSKLNQVWDRLQVLCSQ